MANKREILMASYKVCTHKFHSGSSFSRVTIHRERAVVLSDFGLYSEIYGTLRMSKRLYSEVMLLR